MKIRLHLGDSPSVSHVDDTEAKRKAPLTHFRRYINHGSSTAHIRFQPYAGAPSYWARVSLKNSDGGTAIGTAFKVRSNSPWVPRHQSDLPGAPLPSHKPRKPSVGRRLDILESKLDDITKLLTDKLTQS